MTKETHSEIIKNILVTFVLILVGIIYSIYDPNNPTVYFIKLTVIRNIVKLIMRIFKITT